MLTPGSQTLLNLVALVIKGHREIGVLRIEVRADGAAGAHPQARADAVLAFLVSKGVDPVAPEGSGCRRRRQQGRLHH